MCCDLNAFCTVFEEHAPLPQLPIYREIVWIVGFSMSLSTSFERFCTLACFQINMAKKRKADVGEHFAFDDDTSDSEEEGLEDFQKKVGRLNQSEPLASETSRGQNGDEEDSDDEEDDEESDSEEESSDDESDDIALKPESKLSEEKKLKLSRLQEQLAHIGGESESESDESEEEVELNGTNLQKGDKADDGDEEEEVKDETSEEDGDPESDEDQKAEEIDQDQPENKKMKLDPSSNSVETGEAKARKKYQEQLSKMSIEEIQKLKERLGLKLFHQKMEGTAPERGKKVNSNFFFRFRK